MTSPRIPRRPAILTSAQAEAIVGSEDPAQQSVIAHSLAWALLGVGDSDIDSESLDRFKNLLIHDDGIHEVAPLWSASPAFTLPGALWRLYLLAEWINRDPAYVTAQFERGLATNLIPGREAPVAAPNIQTIRAQCDALFSAALNDDDLEETLYNAATFLRVIAANDLHAARWITDELDPLAHPVTVRTKALLLTAEELDEASRQAAAGTLE